MPQKDLHSTASSLISTHSREPPLNIYQKILTSAHILSTCTVHPHTISSMGTWNQPRPHHTYADRREAPTPIPHYGRLLYATVDKSIDTALDGIGLLYTQNPNGWQHARSVDSPTHAGNHVDRSRSDKKACTVQSKRCPKNQPWECLQNESIY